MYKYTYNSGTNKEKKKKQKLSSKMKYDIFSINLMSVYAYDRIKLMKLLSKYLLQACYLHILYLFANSISIN